MIVALLISFVNAQSTQLSCGSQVNGVQLVESGYATVNAFYGLRYAQAMRFMQAVDEPCDPSAVINATTLGNVCYQFGWLAPRTESDDCLLLDIYAPANATAGSNLQVFFWIHGGGNCFGWSDFYTGLSHMTALENVIVVSVQYRLGAYGYLATRELTREQSFSGNYGIGDLVSALRFVQNQIYYFGGDSNRVILIGQSSGGTNILALLATPIAQGTFAAAISLSGSPNITMPLRAAEAQNAAIFASINWTCTSPACLRQASPASVITALTAPLCGEPIGMPANRQAGLEWAGMVIVDGEIITEGSIAASKSYLVPTIISTMSNEVELLIDMSTVPSSINTFEQQLAISMQQWPSPNKTAKSIVDMYRARPSIADAYTAFLTDYTIACGSLALSAGGSNSVVDVYVSAAPANVLGVQITPISAMYLPFHMWDYMMAFRAWNAFSVQDPLVLPYSPMQSDVATGDVLRKLYLSLNGNIDRNFCVSTSVSRQCIDDVSFGGRVIVQTNKTMSDTLFARCNNLKSLDLDSLRWWWVNK